MKVQTRWVLLLAVMVGGCAAVSRDESPIVRANAVARAAIPHARLSGVATERISPMTERETGLAGVLLGQNPDWVKKRLGSPTKEVKDGSLVWWEYEFISDSRLSDDAEASVANLVCRVGFFAVDGAAAKVQQIQVWAPSREQNARMIRPLDPAIRILRKYGEAPVKTPWGKAEAWVYPEANVAFVVLGGDEKEPAVVAGVIVGL